MFNIFSNHPSSYCNFESFESPRWQKLLFGLGGRERDTIWERRRTRRAKYLARASCMHLFWMSTTIFLRAAADTSTTTTSTNVYLKSSVPLMISMCKHLLVSALWFMLNALFSSYSYVENNTNKKYIPSTVNWTWNERKRERQWKRRRRDSSLQSQSSIWLPNFVVFD